MKILNGEVGFHRDYSSPRFFSKEDIKKVLGNSFDYNKRKSLIQSIADDKIEYLREERKTFMDEISAVENIHS